MFSYIVRRLIAAVLIVFAASYMIYILAANAGDPLEDLRGSTAPNKEQLIAAKVQQLHLDVPPYLRYFIWLGGVLKGFTGNIDLGYNIKGQEVAAQVGIGIGQTVQLVVAATVLAILLGVAIGMATALRQYSGFDYSVTFIAFLFFSLPVFWVAQILKMYVAIGFNNFLADPVVAPWIVIVSAVVVGFAWASIVGGAAKKYFLNFGIATVVTGAGLFFILYTGWLDAPSLGVIGILIIGLAAAFAVTWITAGFSNRKVIYTALVAAVAGAALWYPFNYLFFYVPGYLSWLVVFVVMIAIAVGAAFIFGGDERPSSIRAGVIVAIISSILIIVDRVMASWPDYVQLTNGRPIATIGSSTPNLQGSVWIQTLDNFTHLLLPTIALMLLSLAAWSRYSRGSLLEVMNQDYVRTARAKGLSERTVIMRHAFRNAMIPIATLVAFEIGGIIGGAAITETVFGWNGVGRMFVQAVQQVDLNTVMAVFLITSIVTLVFNLLADLSYSALDPRIRVN
ncbi:ABC transporter permease [Microbacterium sp.]|uniref:ABC transporter permease n=1 Tax=Microbacterium sp. TaxID=51671 RepID=UPI003F709D16